MDIQEKTRERVGRRSWGLNRLSWSRRLVLALSAGFGRGTNSSRLDRAAPLTPAASFMDARNSSRFPLRMNQCGDSGMKRRMSMLAPQRTETTMTKSW